MINMEEDTCAFCYRSEKEVMLSDAIYNNEIVKICQECALLEEIPIIRKPTSYQLKAAEKSSTVYERLSKMTGVSRDKSERQETSKTSEKQRIQEIARGQAVNAIKDEQLSIKKRQELAKKANQPLDLIDNFHWHIQMARRNKKISTSQLASAIGETEDIIKMIESGKLPGDGKKIIRKIEQYLNIRLTKEEFEAEQNRIKSSRQPSRILNFNSEKLKNLKISDLIEMKKQKEEFEKEIKEQKKPEIKEADNKGKIKYDENLIGDDLELIDE